MQLIAQGAEAKLFMERGRVMKERVAKGYRLAELDEALRRFRTRREAKILERLGSLGAAVPGLGDMDERNMILNMEFIEGNKVRDVLDAKSCTELCSQIGKNIAMMHNNGIIHHDLTTSNMIFREGKVNFIDFGLSFFSEKSEDKAVDLHLLRRALESKHHTISEKAFEIILKNYKEHSIDSKETLSRLEKVELRGRNKNKH